MIAHASPSVPWALALAAALALSGCGLFGNDQQAIDGSSPQAFERSLSEARQTLGPRDRLKFEAGLADVRAKAFARADTKEEYQAELRRLLDGRTAAEIVGDFDTRAAKLGNDAADAVFDAKRVIAKGTAAE